MVSYGFTVGLGFSFTFPQHWPLPIVCWLDLLPLFPSLHVPSHCKLMDQSFLIYHVWFLGQLSTFRPPFSPSLEYILPLFPPSVPRFHIPVPLASFPSLLLQDSPSLLSLGCVRFATTFVSCLSHFDWANPIIVGPLVLQIHRSFYVALRHIMTRLFI